MAHRRIWALNRSSAGQICPFMMTLGVWTAETRVSSGRVSQVCSVSDRIRFAPTGNSVRPTKRDGRSATDPQDFEMMCAQRRPGLVGHIRIRLEEQRVERQPRLVVAHEVGGCHHPVVNQGDGVQVEVISSGEAPALAPEQDRIARRYRLEGEEAFLCAMGTRQSHRAEEHVADLDAGDERSAHQDHRAGRPPGPQTDPHSRSRRCRTRPARSRGRRRAPPRGDATSGSCRSDPAGHAFSPA